jgi:hypothetical protein
MQLSGAGAPSTNAIVRGLGGDQMPELHGSALVSPAGGATDVFRPSWKCTLRAAAEKKCHAMTIDTNQNCIYFKTLLTLMLLLLLLLAEWISIEANKTC